MVMNSRGQMALVGMMVGIVMVIIAFQFIPPMQSFTSTARGSTGLNCTLTTISTGEKMTCVAVDLMLPFFIFCVLGAAGGYILGKKIEYYSSPPQQ